ncbi:DUF3097 domain-containing protein [Austwickia chelonae]|uniref:DUF3097 domain-containing protein n=1 Tax=Austwickia chelonae NBRC 105200 TaxID=1184607 RepID=K6VQE1_9MICO|nr:DUF3097 domain-containing protein [Austwickia chelonae]GAB77570.1 hypothetical protein AUCHE_05_04830 [Austwickia chelonae NBRC 105200]
MNSRYDTDPLAGDWRTPRRGRSTDHRAEPGLVVEEATTGWCGAVVAVEKAGGLHVVHLEDRKGQVRAFPLGPGFLIEGCPVTLTPPLSPQVAELAERHRAASRTASGSRAVVGAPARVARASRILVEGRHDAELVEKIWGDDLRVEGVAVEYIEGVDHLAAYVREFVPTAERRLGVLVDHLVPGSKESRLVAQVEAMRPEGVHLKILGHPYVDIWQAVRPGRLGLDEWPRIPREIPWKQGVLAHLGWENRTQADVALGWRRILGHVNGYTDLEPELLAPVEELIDFVTVGPTGIPA